VVGARRYEYEFVRLGNEEKDDYQRIVRERSEQGWRLVQVLAPGAGGLWGRADYVEVIFERAL
jgi:hypothetical protein